MARDGPKAQTENKEKQPITATTQDFLTTDFIFLPPFLFSMGLKKGPIRLCNLPRISTLGQWDQAIRQSPVGSGEKRWYLNKARLGIEG
jgi:hypothetical protein